jgi:hypothetical protein
VIITEGTVEITRQQLDVTSTGVYYYDANISTIGRDSPNLLFANLTVFVLTDSVTGRITREVCVPKLGTRVCYTIDTSANTCSATTGMENLLNYESLIFFRRLFERKILSSTILRQWKFY